MDALERQIREGTLEQEERIRNELREVGEYQREHRSAFRETMRLHNEYFDRLEAAATNDPNFILPESFLVQDARAEQRGSKSRGSHARRASGDPDEDDTCVVCMEKPKTHLLVPCGHKCLCEDCSKKDLKDCPICRKAILQTLKVYQV